MDGELKASYISQLQDVLLAIYSDQGDIADIGEIASSTQRDLGIFYYYEGRFRCKPLLTDVTRDTVVEITSQGPGYTLHLSCSLKYFSESSDQTLIHSGNFHFFHGIAEVMLSGVFVIIDVRPGQVIGSPLYLKLAPLPGERIRDFL
jgi:hypothetical protein